MRDASASPEYALAIRLDATRSQLWLNTLNGLLESWTRIATKNIPGGWELKKDLPPNLFRIARAGDWVVVGCGQDELPLSDVWMQGGITTEDETSWLAVNLDWPRLAQLFPTLAKFDFPAIKMQVIGAGSNLLVNGKFNLSRPLPPLEAWEIPTNLIHPPLDGFTAARGFAPWLQNQSWAGRLQLSPEPDQVFAWSMGQIALQTFICVPVPNATNALAQINQNLSNNTHWENNFLSSVALEKSAYRLVLTGMSLMAPEILALPQPHGEFLFADIFPNLPRGKAPPPELLLALQEDNLVYYHWEITSQRLNDLPQLTQLGMMLTRHQQLNPGSVAAQWLYFIGPALSSSATEITQTGPTELTLHRTATAGLTALELTALANWLEAPNFPGCDLTLRPTKPLKPLHHPIKKLAMPPAMPPGP
jgi:hypothetical protein